MIDHISIAVRDLDVCGRFYELVLAALGYSKLVTRPGTIGFGKKYPEFWLNERRAMTPVDADTGNHICLRASSAEAVQAFHETALKFPTECRVRAPARSRATTRRSFAIPKATRSRRRRSRAGRVNHTRPAIGGFMSFSASVTLCTAFVSIGTMSSTRSVTR